MYAVVMSELTKLKRTLTLKFVWIMPLIALALSFILMRGDYFQFGSYNWWYMFLLPGSLSIFCTSIIQKDAKLKYRNILSLPICSSKIWLGKMLAGFVFLFASCFLFFIGVTIGSYFSEQDIPLLSSALGSFVLFLTYIWQIPLCMFLAKKIGTFGALLINLFANIGFSILSVINGLGFVPYAIPARLMCPILKLHPNGIPLESGNALLSTDIILPAILVSIMSFAVIVIFTTFNSRDLREK